MAAGQPILMPKLGLTMTEGVLAEWKVAPGDQVQPGDVIFVVETDKISNEIEATEAGVIEALRSQVGDVVPVGEIVATYSKDGAPRVEPAPLPAHAMAGSGGTRRVLAAPEAVVACAGSGAGWRTRIVATPLARRLAAAAGLDLCEVTGSGPRGRIMADDVSAALQARHSTPFGEVTAPQPARGEIRALGTYQKVAARRLTEAKREIPHFYVFADADVTELLDLRARLNTDAAFGKLTVNHFLIAAVARALAAMPEINRVWTEDGLLELTQVDIGLAVEGPKGLVAPVLRDLGRRGVDEVAVAATRLIDRARAGRLLQEELQGGATSISNVGMFGATGLLPIINPGQSSILGVGRSQPQFRPDEHLQPRLRQVLSLSLSCDHRVIDGAVAARFLHSIQTSLEAPLSLLRASLQGPTQ